MKLLLLAFTSLTASGASCPQLTNLLIPRTNITSAESISITDNLPYCRVLLQSTPVPDSEAYIEIWLPEPTHWNRKFLGTGNGGYSSQLGLAAMRTALQQGYAVAGSETGHAGGDLKFAIGHPAKIDDWASRAVHVMTETAKPIIRSYYGHFARRSYFSGCSTGGQQALSEAQRYPADYEGIIAGDPGNDRMHLNIGFLGGGSPQTAVLSPAYLPQNCPLYIAP
jgi:feruloyl esterase